MLNSIQKRCYDKLSDMEWKCAYEIQESLNTLISLERKGVIERKTSIGSFWNPRVNIDWKRKVERNGKI